MDVANYPIKPDGMDWYDVGVARNHPPAPLLRVALYDTS